MSFTVTKFTFLKFAPKKEIMPDNNLFTDNLKSTQNMLAASQLLSEIKAVVRHKN